MSELGIRGRIRKAVETVVPWFDRDRADQEHRELQRELRASRAIRQRAVATMDRQDLLRSSFTRAGRRLGE